MSRSWSVQLSVDPGLGRGSRTLRRSTHNIRRISTVSAHSGRLVLAASMSASAANWSWYSSSHVDLMLISRKRANSFEPDDPHPSTMLNAIDSADDTICVLSDPRSPRGNERAARRTPRTSAWALLHTVSRRKSCTKTRSNLLRSPQPQSNAAVSRSFPRRRPATRALALFTTTDVLNTHYLDPLSRTLSGEQRAIVGRL